MSVVDYLPKSKRGLGLAFYAHFLHNFSIKCSLFNTLSMDEVSVSYLFSFPRYQIKCVNKFLVKKVDDVINFEIYLQTTSKHMADREKKRGRRKYKNLNMSRKKRAFQMK